MLQYSEQWFVVTSPWCTALTAVGGATTMVVSMPAEAPFKCYLITVTVKQGAAGAEVLVGTWAGEVLIHDNQVGKDLSSAALAVDALAGNGRDPYTLTPPRIFLPNTTVNVTFTTNVVTRTQARIAFHGALMYERAE